MAIVDKTPRMNPTPGFGGAETPKETKMPKWTAESMMAFLNDELNADFDLGGKTPVDKGDAADTPRQDGTVRSRLDGVKSFFKGIGDGLKSIFSKIGNAISTAFTTIKEAITPERAQAPEPRDPETVRRTETLTDLCKELGKNLETEFQSYLADTTDNPKMDRKAFVATKFPDPPGGIVPQSMGYVGDLIDAVRTKMSSGATADNAAMQTAMLDRLTELPTLDTIVPGLFNSELSKLETQATTFLRSNSAYTRIDKFFALSTIPFNLLAERVMGSVEGAVKEYGHLGIVQGSAMNTSDMTADQAKAFATVSDGILNALLDVDPANDESLLNSIPQEYRDHLSAKAEEIVNRPGNATVEERTGAIKMMYVNSIFLRGINGDMSSLALKMGEGGPQKLLMQSMNGLQTFLNGAGNAFATRSSPHAAEAMTNIIATHSPRLDAFLQAVGMPVIANDNAATE